MKLAGKGVDKLRYAYYCSFDFYNFLGSAVGTAWAFLVAYLQIEYQLWNLALTVAMAILGGFFLALLVLKTFLCMDQKSFYTAGACGGISAIPWAIGIYLLFENVSAILQLIGAAFIAIGITWIALNVARAQRIKIYPNRIVIGKHTFHYQDMVKVQWGVGALERTQKDFSEDQQQKPLEILTPLLFESVWKDFSLSHYYIVIEMPEKMYVAQPVFWRNSFAQNARNGWLETWRWDGSTQPPINITEQSV